MQISSLRDYSLSSAIRLHMSLLYQLRRDEEIAAHPHVSGCTTFRARFRLGLMAERGLDFVGHRVAAQLPAATRILVNGGNCALAGVNWVHFVHSADRFGSRTLRDRARRAIAVWSEKRAISKARLIIANSNRTRADLFASFDTLASLVRTVYCGVDPDRFFPVEPSLRGEVASSLGFRPELRRLVFVGALGDDRKGFSVLFEAWRALAARWDGYELIVVGRGRQLPSWIRAAGNENLLDRIQFLGSRDDVAEVLKSSDLLVAPSRYEPYGLNIAEALSCGIPVIASKMAGACERISGELNELLLAEPWSSAELLCKLELWRSGGGKYKQAAVLLSREFRNHSWKTMSGTIYDLIEEAYG